MYLCKNSFKLRLEIRSYSFHNITSENNNKKTLATCFLISKCLLHLCELATRYKAFVIPFQVIFRVL